MKTKIVASKCVTYKKMMHFVFDFWAVISGVYSRYK